MPFQIRTLPSAEPSLLIEPRVTPNNLVSLQALRAGAAISVSLVHLNLISVMLQGGSNERATLYPLASGVDLFFVISGFIMVYSSGQLFGKSDSLYIFFMRRIARVVPIYWLTMSIDLFLERKPLSLTNLFGSYFFVPFMESDGSIVPLYGVGWTLNFEMFFYCVFSIMIMFRRSIAILGVSTVLFSMMVLENLLQTPPIPVIFWSDPIVFEFIFGMLLAVIYRRGIRLPLPICLAMIVAGVCAVWWPSPSMPPLGWWVSPSGSRFLFWGIPATMVVAGAILQRRSLPFAVPRPIEILGNASYSVYLVHILVFNSILILWPYGLNTFPILVVLICGEALTIVVSVGSYYLFEHPMNRLIQRLLIGRGARGPASAVRVTIPLPESAVVSARGAKPEPGPAGA